MVVFCVAWDRITRIEKEPLMEGGDRQDSVHEVGVLLQFISTTYALSREGAMKGE
jgi:hypothetical protein